MKLVRKLLSRSRLSKLRGELASNPTPMNYATLAHEHAVHGEVREALRVCEEGLALFRGSTELARLAERIRHRCREGRMRELKLILRDGARPAVWKEMCTMLIEAGQVGRAEEYCLDWIESQSDGDGEGYLMLARVRTERFYGMRNREEGLAAFDALDDAAERMPRDSRPWQMRLTLAMRVGAWAEARRSAKRLLDLDPGDPALEARYRTLEARAASSPTVDQALHQVELSGVLVDEDQGERPHAEVRDVRPLLKSLAKSRGVRAAVYQRGGTALVQGPRGATAERAARAVRSIVMSGRGTARRLGLGQISSVLLENELGHTLTVAAGEMDAGAIWCAGHPTEEQEQALLDLAGFEASVTEEPN